MHSLSNTERMNLSNAKALRRAREILKVTRTELGISLGVSDKSVEKYENGRVQLDDEKIINVLRALNMSWEDFKKIKKGKRIGPSLRKERTVTENSQRRSYKKIITKEVRVLTLLRKMKNLSQDEASAICGYSRPTIGHIENGRIEVPQSRIMHLVSSYGFEFAKFEELMKEEVLRDEIIESCTSKLLSLPEDKLKLIQSVLDKF